MGCSHLKCAQCCDSVEPLNPVNISLFFFPTCALIYNLLCRRILSRYCCSHVMNLCIRSVCLCIFSALLIHKSQLTECGLWMLNRQFYKIITIHRSLHHFPNLTQKPAITHNPKPSRSPLVTRCHRAKFTKVLSLSKMFTP